jgi:hypothetical protein
MPNPYHTAGDRAVTSRAGQFKNAFVGNDAERSGTSQLSAVPQPSVGRLFKGDGPAGAVSHRGQRSNIAGHGFFSRIGSKAGRVW